MRIYTAVFSMASSYNIAAPFLGSHVRFWVVTGCVW